MLLTVLKKGCDVLIASKWRPDNSLKLKKDLKVPLWIRLPGLAPVLWNQKVSWSLVSALGGDLVGVDIYMQTLLRLGFMDVCVDLPLNFFPKPVVEIEMDGQVLLQEVTHERRIKFCSPCRENTHLTEHCHWGRNEDGTQVAGSLTTEGWFEEKILRRSTRSAVQGRVIAPTMRSGLI